MQHVSATVAHACGLFSFETWSQGNREYDDHNARRSREAQEHSIGLESFAAATSESMDERLAQEEATPAQKAMARLMRSASDRRKPKVAKVTKMRNLNVGRPPLAPAPEDVLNKLHHCDMLFAIDVETHELVQEKTSSWSQGQFGFKARVAASIL